MILVGGHFGRQKRSSELKYFGDVWSFDLDEFQFKCLVEYDKRLAKSWFNLIRLNNELILFGMGYCFVNGKEKYYNDFYSIEFQSNNNNNKPMIFNTINNLMLNDKRGLVTARNRATMLALEDNKVFIAFGNSFECSKGDTFYFSPALLTVNTTELKIDVDACKLHPDTHIQEKHLNRGHADGLLLKKEENSYFVAIVGGERERKRLHAVLVLELIQ